MLSERLDRGVLLVAQQWLHDAMTMVLTYTHSQVINRTHEVWQQAPGPKLLLVRPKFAESIKFDSANFGLMQDAAVSCAAQDCKDGMLLSGLTVRHFIWITASGACARPGLVCIPPC